ncbi:MAG: adenylosuccinate lyase [Hymenobacter sp.]
MRYRVRVEVEYFIALCELPLATAGRRAGRRLFQPCAAYMSSLAKPKPSAIKAHEAVTNHDVKAVEYYLRDEFTKLNLSEFLEFIHFGLTSQDVNNTAIPLSLKEAMTDVLLAPFRAGARPTGGAGGRLGHGAHAGPHPRPARLPTRLGKELEVFVARLDGQLTLLHQVPYAAKFGGATGGFNAHFAAYPGTDWHAFAQGFVANTLGLHRSFPTTQIEPYDNLAAFCDGWKRLNTILIDFCRDVWQYISLGYFRQTLKAGEVGSSAMPHKVNPIDFENAEGNLGVANALLEHFAAKLPISRLQRDLTDSTVLRNLGVPLGHLLIALGAIARGLGKLALDESALARDLDQNWAVLAEAIQTILRRENYPDPYNALKQLTRTGTTISAATIAGFVEELNVPESVKAELRALTPAGYVGR